MAQEKQDNQTEALELFPYDPVVIFWDVVRRWKLIAAVAILAGMLAFAATELLYQPSYSTNTTFVVSVQGNSATVYENLNATNGLATVFSQVMNSSLMRQTILEELNMSAFNGSIQASPVEETNLLTLTVTDRNPRTAFLVAKTIIETHDVVTRQVLGDIILEVLQEPVVPAAPSNALVPMGNMKKAMVLTAVLTAGLLAVHSFLRDTVRSKREGEKKLDERVLGELRHERKKRSLKMLLKKQKTSILITNPATSFSFVEKIRKLRRQVEQHMPSHGKVVMVTSVLENEGKSTVAVNLALSMAQKHKRVLLIDADLRRPACYKVLEQPWRAPGTADVIMGKNDLLELAVPCKKMKNLSLLLETRECKNSTDLVSSDGMEALLEQARENFDYVIVDTPPMSVGPDGECLADLADGTLLVVRQNEATVEMINSALDVLNLAKSKLLGYILNNVYTSGVSAMGGYGYGYGYGYGHSYGYGYGHYGSYGHYGHYGHYGAYSKSGKSSKAGNEHES